MILVAMIGIALAVGGWIAIASIDPPEVRAAIAKSRDDLRQWYLDTPVEHQGELLYLEWLGEHYEPHRPFPEEPIAPPFCDGWREETREICYFGVWRPAEWYIDTVPNSWREWERQRAEFEAAWRAWEP